MSVQRIHTSDTDKSAMVVKFIDDNQIGIDERAGDDYDMDEVYKNSLTCPPDRVPADNSPVDKLPSA